MPSAQPPRAVFAMDPVHLPLLFPSPLMARLRQTAEIDPGLVVQDFADPGATAALAGAEVLITGWGCPHLDADALAAAPRLRTVLHAAGSVRSLVGEALWERGVTVSSAVTGNALPVAEYTLAMILLAGKDTFAQRERFRHAHAYPTPAETAPVGNLGRRIGVIGASRVGRRLLELLRPYDFEVLLHDPYVSVGEAAALGAELLPLDHLLSGSDIVSLHAPDIPETQRMLDRGRLALIRDGGVLINTAGRPDRPRGPHRRAVVGSPDRDPGRHRTRATAPLVPAVPAAERLPHPAHRGLPRQRTGAARRHRRRRAGAPGRGPATGPRGTARGPGPCRLIRAVHRPSGLGRPWDTVSGPAPEQALARLVETTSW